MEFLGAFLSPDIIYHYWSLDLLNSQRCFVLNQDLALAQTPLPVFPSLVQTRSTGYAGLPTWEPMLFSWLDFLTVLTAHQGQVKTMDTQSLFYWLSPQM